MPRNSPIFIVVAAGLLMTSACGSTSVRSSEATDGNFTWDGNAMVADGQFPPS